MYDDNTYDYEGDPAFWPDEDEFKDMLLNESRFRVELAGDWTTPFVRQETKWRYRLYKKWLSFLDEGFDDGEFNEEREYMYSDNGENGYRPSSPRWRVPGDALGVDSDIRNEKAGDEGSSAKSRAAIDYEERLANALSASDGWTDLEEEERAIEQARRRRSSERRSGREDDLRSWFDTEDEISPDRTAVSPGPMEEPLLVSQRQDRRSARQERNDRLQVWQNGKGAEQQLRRNYVPDTQVKRGEFEETDDF